MMLKKLCRHTICLGLSLVLFCLDTASTQIAKAPKKRTGTQSEGSLAKPNNGKSAKLSSGGCCEDMRMLKIQVANLTSLLGELSRKHESDWINIHLKSMELENSKKVHEDRLLEAESKISEMNGRLEIMQLQAAQTVTQTTADAIYDCSTLYKRNYKISGVYKLPKDEFLGTPDLEVHCDMETNGGGWTLIQRRKIGLTSFNRDWKQYKEGFGTIRGDFWLGNENIFRLTRQPSVLRIDLEDWEGETRYAEYGFFTISNERNNYKLFISNYSGNAGGDSLRYHNNTNFSTKNKDNDKCVDDCAQLRKGGYWYNCCTDSNLNGVFYRYGEHAKSTDGITWYGWHGSSYSLKRVEMKMRPQNFVAQN
ncbi:angiopoietin-related protein 7 [Erpetoichthys calabaricus]|uniref:angiopoietin-related protein 7 n=1 Tax=Erpetoichthys calabaricus TaxID=27687 RepID=UPI00109F0D07|nr:angiopoietin-related protein 7 [Erpetoichthys calabaricus]